jgi:RNA polymerase sigma-70 factor (ECF subfamily)
MVKSEWDPTHMNERMDAVSELDLIKRARQGDEGAMGALYARHAPPLYRLAYGLLGNHEDSEEVVQDALAYALGRLDAYDAERAAFRTWLHTITVSRCRNKRWRRWLPTTVLSDWLRRGGDVHAPVVGPEGRLLADENARQVREALDKLSDKVREVVVLRYWGGHSLSEIARIVGCPTPTAQSRLRLAHEQMERHLHGVSTLVIPLEEVR